MKQRGPIIRPIGLPERKKARATSGGSDLTTRGSLRQMQRIVLAILLPVLVQLSAIAPVYGQAADTRPGDDVQPLLPPGISEFNLEITGRLAYTWQEPDGTQVIEVHGDFDARLGQHRLTSRDGVVFFHNRRWQDKAYIDFEIFLWQDAEVLQPGGTVENGPALLVTLRTFGKLVLNADGHVNESQANGELFQEASRVRRLLDVVPAEQADKSGSPVQIAPSAEVALHLRRAKPARRVNFSAADLSSEEVNGQMVVIANKDVMVSQGTPSDSAEYVEIRADAAVIFLKRDKVSDTLPGMLDQDRKKSKDRAETQPSEGPPRKSRGANKDDVQAMQQWVSSVYLEGDVVLSRGDRLVRASKLYYDFDADRALILDAVTRAVEPKRQLPIYVRAEEIRQLTATEYEARKATISTSEFHTPHVAIGADQVYLEDKTLRDESGRITGIRAGKYKAKDTTLRVEGTPIAYWPYSTGDFSEDRMAFKDMKTGYDSNFGYSTQVEWYLFNLLGLEEPEGFNAILKTDYFTDRGPAIGIDSDYTEENYYGLLRTYYINDHGEDQLGEQDNDAPAPDNRGRALWRHRQYLPKDWELALEASYLSDENFLQEYYRNEYENGKEQETLAYLLKRQDNWQFSLLGQYRLNDFLTQTEHFPDARFDLIGEPIGDYATWYNENRLSAMRYLVNDEQEWTTANLYDPTDRSTPAVLRGDIREELQFPIGEIGPLQLTPYVMGRLTAYDDGPGGWDPDVPDSGFCRPFGSYGLHGNMLLSKTDDSVESELLDLHRLRHIIKPDFSVWGAHSTYAPDELTPFDDDVELIQDASGGTVGVRQRFQTKRGGPGKWRNVDWIIWDMEAGFFNDSDAHENTHGDYVFSRPEDSISSNFLFTYFEYRISDSTVLVYDSDYDFNEGNFGTNNISLGVERDPRMSYFVGWRYIHDTNNNVLGFRGNYKLNEKHIVSLQELYDVEAGRNVQTEVAYVRKWPRWYTAVSFSVDETIDDWGVTFSIWPEGAPNLGLGSKGYVGLADSVGIRP